jgi:hypothetical protein
MKTFQTNAIEASDRSETQAISCLENLRGKDNLEDLGVDGKINIIMDLRNTVWVWSGFIWLRIRTSGELL